MATEWSDDIAIADLADEPALSEELSQLIDRVGQTEGDQAPHVVLNFGQVNHVHSSNLAQLLRLRSRMNERGKRLLLCSLSEDVWQVLKVTGLDKVFRFAPDPMTALATLQLEQEPER